MNGTAVVVTCHNLGRYVEEALDSVTSQGRPASELVVIDDGSDDPYTRYVLARVERTGTSVIRTDNRGVAAARNLGLTLTSSPYVVLLDADDVLDPAYIERLGGVLDERQDTAFVTCAIRAFGEADYIWTPPPCHWARILARGGPHISSMFRRSVWEMVGGFDTTLDGYEDMDFWLTAVERGCQGEVVAEPLLRYRVRAGSRYHRAIQADRYISTMARIHGKHPPPSERERVELLLDKDRFIEEQRSHEASLRSREQGLERTIAALGEQLADVSAALTRLGSDLVDWGDLRRLSPMSPVWGLDRGSPLDRHYIEQFLERHRADIRGRVAEIKDAGYSTRFGGSAVVHQDVIDVDPGNPQVTMLVDLSVPDSLPADAFDCIVFTQTLHIIYDTQTVLKNLYRSLTPGGVLLCTVPSVSRVSYEDGGLEDGDFWRFTEASARAAFAEVFPVDAIDVVSRGNVMMCAAFLHGLDPGEVPADMLETDDPAFPLICGIRAVKPASARRNVSRSGSPCAATSAATLLYHRVGSRDPDTHHLCIDTEAFRDQMRYLRDHCQPVSLDVLVANLHQRDLPDRAVAVTFDDGYLEHLTVVSPILLEFGVPATFFVNTAHLDEPCESWWDTLERIFTSGTVLPPTLDLSRHGAGILDTGSEQDRRATHRTLVERMYSASVQERDALMTALAQWSGLELSPRPTHRLMTAAEIVELGSRPGHTIGAHTVNHLALPLHEATTQGEEIAGCKADLERVMGCPVAAFAYPYGEHSRHTLEAVRKAGFSIALTVEGRAVLPGAERLLLPRFEVGPSVTRPFSSLLQHVASAHPLESL